MPQVLQLLVLQVPQALPVPAMGAATPPSSLEKEAKEDNIRSALFWQWGQEDASLARLKVRSNSNFKPQSEQTYSYIGIFSSIASLITFR